MIGITSNSKRVAEAFKELREEFPKQFSSLLTNLGMSMRKDIMQSIKGKGPISVAPINKVTKQIRSWRGISSRQLGGQFAKTIRYVKDKKNAVRVETTAGQMGEFYQTKERRAFTRPELLLVARATIRKLREDYHDDRVYNVAKKKITFKYDRPARQIFKPYAKWPGLTNRLKNSGTKMLQRMAEKAARKAAQAAA